jgi:membrane fusion protein (multidrug efflux system)
MRKHVNEIGHTMKKVSFTLVLTGILLLAGCGGGNNNENSPGMEEAAGIPVEVITVEAADIVNTVDATGAVDALYDADVSAETSGRIAAIIHDVGSRVREGDAVIQLDGETQRLSFQQSQAQLRIAEAAVEKADKDLERMEDLYAKNDISVNDIEQASLRATQARGEHELAEASHGLAKKALDDTEVAAPFDGEVTATYINVGEMVAPGQIVYTIVNADTVKIEVDVSAADVGEIRDGLFVEVQVTALPDEIFHGEVSTVAVKANETTRTYAVEIIIENLDHRLRPGMLADVKIQTGRLEDAVSIPLDAILQRNGSSVVFIEQDGRAAERRIEISAVHGASAVISSGLEAGERLIVIGQHNLDDGRNVLVTD